MTNYSNNLGKIAYSAARNGDTEILRAICADPIEVIKMADEHNMDEWVRTKSQRAK